LTVQTAGFTLAANVRTLIVGASFGVQHVTIHNHEHSQNREIFVGGPDVTIENGMHAAATQTNTVQLLPSDELYAISGDNGVNIRVLVVK
jgi:hypothetical protein